MTYIKYALRLDTTILYLYRSTSCTVLSWFPCYDGLQPGVRLIAETFFLFFFVEIVFWGDANAVMEGRVDYECSAESRETSPTLHLRD